MAIVLYETEKEIWVFSSRQMGGIKALVNMLQAGNDPLEEITKQTFNEAKEKLPAGVEIEDIKVETSDLNGPVINVTVKAVKNTAN